MELFQMLRGPPYRINSIQIVIKKHKLNPVKQTTVLIKTIFTSFNHTNHLK